MSADSNTAPASTERGAVRRLLGLARFHLRKHGLIPLLRLAFLRLWRATVDKGEWVFLYETKRLSGSNADLPPSMRIDRYTRIEDVPRDYVEELARLKGGADVADGLLRKFFVHDGTLWIISHEGRYAGYQWTIVGGIDGTFFMPLTSQDVGIYAVETFPEFRGRGIYPVFLSEAVKQLAREGFQRVFIGCKVWNESSLQAQRKADARGLASAKSVLGVARELDLFGRRVVIWRSTGSD